MKRQYCKSAKLYYSNSVIEDGFYTSRETFKNFESTDPNGFICINAENGVYYIYEISLVDYLILNNAHLNDKGEIEYNIISEVPDYTIAAFGNESGEVVYNTITEREEDTYFNLLFSIPIEKVLRIECTN
jgi:hypothetical protein